jgi:NAD-dependent dihydropyrimidine dehydrogenase PreA subunit
MAHRKQGYRFKNDWTKEHLETVSMPYYETIETIPVNVEIKADHLVLNLENAKKILSKAHTISVVDCNCRIKRGNCDAPLNVCIDMDAIAERNIADGRAREINLEKALDILELSHRAGLVHLAMAQAAIYEPDVIHTICSCCSCCCTQLSGLLRFGLAPHLLTPLMTSVTNVSDCTECGVCAERCQFGAREMINGSLSYNPDLCYGCADLCYGCGLCVSTCPANAITLIDK